MAGTAQIATVLPLTKPDKGDTVSTMKITATVEYLTPEDANRLLDRNTHNRPLNQGDILKWATEMEAGNWQVNGEAIKIATDGSILDGQHRLHALALQSDGTVIGFLMVRGLEPETQESMDQGRRRSASDQLNLAGVDSSGLLASALRFYLRHELGLLFRDRKIQDAEVTTPVIIHWAQSHPEEVDILRHATSFKKIKARNAVVATAYLLITKHHDPEVADEFMARMQDGAGLELGSPILAMRNRLDALRGTDTARGTRSVAVSDRDMLGMFIVSFNGWITGKTLAKVQRPPGGSWNEHNYPEIITQRGLKRSAVSKRVAAKRAAGE